MTSIPERDSFKIAFRLPNSTCDCVVIGESLAEYFFKETDKRVIKLMSDNNIGSVVVTDKAMIPKGIFTERDLLTKFLAKDRSLKIEVGRACSSPIITAPIGISVHDAAAIMTLKHINRLPITQKGKLVGMLSARDLIEAYARTKKPN